MLSRMEVSQMETNSQNSSVSIYYDSQETWSQDLGATRTKTSRRFTKVSKRECLWNLIPKYLIILSLKSRHKECLLHVIKHPHLFLRPFWRIHPKKTISDVATETMVSAMKAMVRRYKDSVSKDSNTRACEDNQHIPLIKLMLDKHWSEKEILDNFATFIFAVSYLNYHVSQINP